MSGPLDWWASFVRSLGWLDAIRPPFTSMSAVAPQLHPVQLESQQVYPIHRTCNLLFERVYYEYDNRESSLSDSGLVDQVGQLGSIEIKRIDGDRLLSEELGKEFQECKLNPNNPERTCSFQSLPPAPGDVFTVSFPGGLESQAISIERGPDTARLFLAEHPDPEHPGNCEVGEWKDWQKEDDGKFAFPLKDVKGVKSAKSRVYTCKDFDCSTPRPARARARRGYPIDFRFYA
ncbi:hypothetical protein AOL_s00215g18 [Orbilia oligospora ATCC 24927]|uniref:Uncharacterized protein n=1 Tax=Arthrobotrys oligospora (strain ATCC 24927 / CBS 115.81 / DSM 1491) TaxID=756982 RepID=G1XT89_ARTOA|nr:hypothetical protein AOL_s00215g18 [Orbilia oligospora ATCC 24927]EGX43282.1 hypothetical protein AOL_s00215g18 [Orbilia oligospora ATCC 24927]